MLVTRSRETCTRIFVEVDLHKKPTCVTWFLVPFFAQDYRTEQDTDVFRVKKTCSAQILRKLRRLRLL